MRISRPIVSFTESKGQYIQRIEPLKQSLWKCNTIALNTTKLILQNDPCGRISFRETHLSSYFRLWRHRWCPLEERGSEPRMRSQPVSSPSSSVTSHSWATSLRPNNGKRSLTLPYIFTAVTTSPCVHWLYKTLRSSTNSYVCTRRPQRPPASEMATARRGPVCPERALKAPRSPGGSGKVFRLKDRGHRLLDKDAAGISLSVWLFRLRVRDRDAVFFLMD